MSLQTRGLDADSTDEWIALAMSEYERVAALCNAMSLLANAASNSRPPAPPLTDAPGDDDAGGLHGDEFDPRRLRAELDQRRLRDLLSGYHDAINEVRNAHASLKRKLVEMKAGDEGNEGGDGGGGRRRGRPPPFVEAAERHVALGERVVRTVMRTSPRGGGPCGMLFQNGLVRTPTAADHEANVVALASLRASASRLKKTFGSGGDAGRRSI